MQALGGSPAAQTLFNGEAKKPRKKKPYVHSNGSRPKKRPEKGKKPPREKPDDMRVDDVDPDKPPKVLPRQSQEQFQSIDKTQDGELGPLFPNASALGFRPKTSSPRPVPRYLISQERQLSTPAFKQDDWDKANQEKMLQMEAANHGKDYQGLYEEFQRLREVERTKMEQLGLVDAENTRKDLNDAIAFQGTCVDMCPIFERVRRALENNVKALEKDPTTNKIARDRAVKAFSRPAAGQPPPLPSEVRPPHVLVKSLDYLIDEVLPKLPDAHSFLWDRTRSIRQDFTYQNSFGPEAIDCNERIVRIHLVTLHVMAATDVEYSQQQELEQFNKALQTLVEIYQDIRNHGGSAPNEAEFRAYHLLSHIKDPELEREIQQLPEEIFASTHIQLALRFRSLAAQNNIVERGYTNLVGALNMFSEFFKLVYSKETPFLMACLLETHFNEIRFYALKAMSRCYHTRGKAYSGEKLKEVLGFHSIEKLVEFVKYYDIDIIYGDDGELLVDLFNKDKLESKYKLKSMQEKPKLSQPYSKQIDVKFYGYELKLFVNSGKPNKTLNLRQPSQRKIVKSDKLNQLLAKAVEAAPANQSSASPTLSDYLALSTTPNKPVFGQAVAGFTPQKVSQLKPPQTFSVQQPAKASTALKPEVSVSKPDPKPVFSFSPPKAEAVPNKPASTPAFPPAAPAAKSTPSVLFSLPKAEPVLAPVNTPKPIAPIAPVAPTHKKLSDKAQYPQALQQVLADLVSTVTTEELSKLLPKLIKAENRNRERHSLIASFGAELYQAFISEIIYKHTQTIQANHFHRRHLKKRTIELVVQKARKLKEQHELRSKKLAELNSISFKVPPKRKPETPASEPVKRRHVSVDIGQRQAEVRRLWEPLDIGKFLGRCSRNIKLGIESEVHLKFLLVVENWRAPYAKWLSTKLSLQVNQEKKIYESTVSDDKMAVTLQSLPPNNYLNQDFFQTSAFILFECGFSSEDQLGQYKDIHAKLKRDQAVLAKLVQLCTRYSYYRVQIVLLFWDTSNSGIEEGAIRLALKADEHPELDVVLCDMTRKDTDIHELLQGAFTTLSGNFKGMLSARGLRKKKVVKAKPAVITSPKKADTLQMEVKMLKKAKVNRQFTYLTQHINTSYRDRTNTLMDTSYMSAISRTFNNSTFLNLNSSFNDSGVNTLILPAFGVGVLEENTPFASPKGKSFAKPNSKLQQLRELTAGIKSRYKSNSIQ